jgi:uncharacterized protein YjbJ (UPF0337 family)
MKKLSFIALTFALIACNKTAENSSKLIDSTKIIDSMNAVIQKHNDSVKSLNNKNSYSDLSGAHKLSFTNDDGLSFSGSVRFTKIMSDGYEVKGNAKSGNNSLTIDGKADRVSAKHINFYGKITQTINGKTESKKQSNTFRDEGKGNFFRLQEKVNQDGFVDYIDIYK